FLDNPTFRGMRWNLLKTYDKIYTIDLHGNSKKKETAPDGSKDENVFDIMQGVSINFFIKNGKKKAGELAQVFHFDLYGKREIKYRFFETMNLYSNELNRLPNVEPDYLFIKKDFDLQKDYERGFRIQDLLEINVLGFQTHRDNFSIAFEKHELKMRLKDLLDKSTDDEIVVKKYNISENNHWKIKNVRNKLANDENIEKDLIKIDYRPFDSRYCLFNKNIVDRPRNEIIQHIKNKINYCFNIVRQTKRENWSHVVISSKPTPAIYVEVKDGSNVFPLYLYSEKSSQQTISATNSRTPNLNMEIVSQIAEKLGLTFVPEKEPEGNVCYINNPEVRNDYKTTFAPVDLLDYIYAVLHSPAYREKYKEFLKIDFPRVPYPTDVETFWRLVELGSQLREIHLLESPKVSEFITSYPIDGNNTVTRKMTTKSIGWEATNSEKTRGHVWINDTQYFDGVPLVAWEFYIGGYQPAQKWLKDRHGRTLGFNDILHYQKIIVALTETHRLMQEIDKVGVENR
ncbi:MAG: type ISP restriction/modification enzyme, partial [Mariniphaga sp.]